MSKLLDAVLAAELPKIDVIQELQQHEVSHEVVQTVFDAKKCTLREVQSALVRSGTNDDLRNRLTRIAEQAIVLHEAESTLEAEMIEAQAHGYGIDIVNKERFSVLIERARTVIALALNETNLRTKQHIERREIDLHLYVQAHSTKINFLADTEAEKELGTLNNYEDRALEAEREFGNESIGDFTEEQSYEVVAKLKEWQRHNTKPNFGQFIEFLQSLSEPERQCLYPEFRLVCKKASEYLTKGIMVDNIRFYRKLEDIGNEFFASSNKPEHEQYKQIKINHGSYNTRIPQMAMYERRESITTTDVVAPYIKVQLEEQYEELFSGRRSIEDSSF